MKNIVIALGLLLALQHATAATACTAKPPQDRELYLRGSFTAWDANDKLRFAWVCDRYELVASLKGEHRLKVADEAWKGETDFGAEPPEGSVVLPFNGQAKRMVPVGAPMSAKFDGTYRFVLRMADSKTPPELSATTCPVAPSAAPKLYLRGTPNNWTVLDEFALQYSCDAHYLNVKLTGAHSFKIGDKDWAAPNTFGAPPAAGAGRVSSNQAVKLALGSDPGGTHDLSYTFAGEHTLRLDLATQPPTLSIGPKSFADPAAKAVSDPVALSLRFDSRQLAHRSPFGAVPSGSTVSFAIDAGPEGQTTIRSMHLRIDNRRLEGNQELLEYSSALRIPMLATLLPGGKTRYQVAHKFPTLGVFGYWFEVNINGQTFAYQNNSDAVFWTREKGSGGLGEVAEFKGADGVRRYRISVFDPAFKVPAWAADAVYYYVFPERFRNGNRANDPKPGRDKYQNHTVELHKNWNEPPFKPGSGDGSDAVFNNDFFGGDLQGIIDKLDTIQRTGANTLYLTPIFKAASNHKYDTADYMQVDPAFGSNADFTRLTKEAKKRGIRVMVDTSLNHTGADSPYFDRFNNFNANPKKGGAFLGGKVNPASPYASWYSFDASQSDPNKQFKGWVGVADLPELNKNDPAFRDFAYKSPNSVTRTWLKRGASGWRMDVAPWVPDDFWREWRVAVKSTQPDAMTISETWFDASKHVLGDMFDSTMNYVFRNTVLEFANGGNAAELYRNLEHLREAYPPQALHAMMNLLSGHDQARALHHLGWHDDKTTLEQIALAKKRMLLATAFQFTYPGSPALYYGDEVGVTGGDDPYNRATYPWADKGGKPDTVLQQQFQKLAQLRQQHPVLRHGELLAPVYADATTLVLARRMPPNRPNPKGQATHALVILHNGNTERELTFKAPAGFEVFGNQGTVNIKLQPLSHQVLFK